MRLLLEDYEKTESFEIEIYAEMVEELCKQCCVSIRTAIRVLSIFYDLKYTTLRNDIKNIRPEWFSVTMQIYGFIDGEPIKRPAFKDEYDIIIQKISSRLRNSLISSNIEDSMIISDKMLRMYKPTIKTLFEGY